MTQTRALRTKRKKSRNDLSGYFYIAPFFIVFGVFGAFPIVYTAWIALHDWNPIGTQTWVGLDNFTFLVSDPRFWNAVRNTFSIWFISTVPQLLFALILAAALNNALLKWATGYRMSILVPQVTSVLAVGIIFTQIFGREFGLANYLLESFGMERLDWQSGVLSSHVAISTMVMWRWTGYNALIYLAAMQSIPRDLYEVADIDGANTFRKFFHITIPQIRPAIIFTVIISTIGGMQVFAEPLIFGGNSNFTGGSDRQFQTLTMLLYEQGFGRFKFGYASAIAWALFVIILIVSIVNYMITRRISRE